MREKQFDESGASKFRANGLKIAVCNAEPAIYGKPSWAGPEELLAFQAFGGRHFTISIPLFRADGTVDGWDTYGSDQDEFRQHHTLVQPFPGFPSDAEGGLWIKNAAGVIIEAYQLTEDDAGGATILKEGAETSETSDFVAPVGHWRIRQPGGEIQDTAPAQFDYLYEPVSPPT